MVYRFAFFLLVSLLGFPAMAQKKGESLVDRVVAVVNDEPVLHSEVRNKIEKGQVVIISAHPAPDDAPDFEKALQDQINYELVLQKVDELEIAVEDGEVEGEIKKFLKNRDLDQEGLEAALRQQGMTYDQYFEDFRGQMLMNKFKGRVINPLIKITDKDLESYYLKKVGSTSDKVKLHLSQIYIKIPVGANTAVRQGKATRAQEAFNQLRGGASFSEVAKGFSDASDVRETGGKMGAIKLSDLSAAFRDVIEPLNVGEYTEPVETPAGYYIFYVDEKNFASDAAYKQQRKQLEFELRNFELANQTRRWLTEQRRRSKIEIIK